MTQNPAQEQQENTLLRFAMRLSLVTGFGMLGMKVFAYSITGSVAILSDAAESVVHVVAVSFAAYSLWLSFKPADRSHHYGHDKITFFSAGFEGAMIVLAAFYIIYASIHKWLHGLQIENLGKGTLLTLAAALINAALGGYLVWVGKKHRSLILEANGKHVLTDSWTSFGVVAGLGLALATGYMPLDPIVAILVALNILWTGGKLMRQSAGGLMDEGNPQVETRIRQVLKEMAPPAGADFHGLRHRSTGNTLWVEFHLLFPQGTTLDDAHTLATQIEERIQRELGTRTEVISHLETLEDHHAVHSQRHFEHFPE
ncbi:MAG: cation diffusion facilitator family transporter [Terriglobia bacterium]|jgi:cation diffusion facilitator family transporter